MRAGLGEAGQRCAVFAVPGGRVGHIDVRRGHVQRNRVGLAVVCADVVLDRIDDAVLLRLQELHDLGTLHGGIVLLLDPVPDGVRANFAEAGLVGAVFAALGGGIAHLRVRGGDVQLNGVRLAVGIAAVAPGAVLDDARIDCHGACAIRGCIAHLFQQEPDDIVAGIGEHGQRFAYYAALLGIGHVNALGEHVQRNRVRLAVVVAGVVLHGVEDRARLRDGYSGGVHDGLVALLLQLEPDGVRAYVGKAGHVGAVFAALGGGVGRAYACGGHVQQDAVHTAVAVDVVVLHAVIDLAQLQDGHAGGVHDGLVALLLQLEPDGVAVGFGVRGVLCAVCTVPGFGIGHGNALGGHAEGDGVRLAVVVAGVVVYAVLDLGQFCDGHGGGAGDGLVARLLQPEPDGVFAGVGEAGLIGGVRAVLGGGKGRSHALGGHAQINRVCLSVERARVIAGRVLDLLRGDAVGMGDPCVVIRAAAVYGNGVAADIAGGLGELLAALVVVGERPGGNAGAAGGEAHGAAGEGVFVLFVEGHQPADVRPRDRHGRGARCGLVALAFELVVNRVPAGAGKRGLRFGVRAVGGCGVGHRDIRCGDVQRNRVLPAVVRAGVVSGGVLDYRSRLDDAELVGNISAISVALTADCNGILVIHFTGRTIQIAVAQPVYDRPLFDFVGRRIELHGFSSPGEDGRKRGFYLGADVFLVNLYTRRARFGIVVILFEHIVNRVLADFGECGHGFAVLGRAIVTCGSGVARFDTIRADSHCDRVRLAIVIALEVSRLIKVDLFLRFDDGELMIVDVGIMIWAAADDFDAVVAYPTWRRIQRAIVI